MTTTIKISETPGGGWEWSDGTLIRGTFDSPEDCIADWRSQLPRSRSQLRRIAATTGEDTPSR